MADKFVTFQINEKVKEDAEKMAKDKGLSLSALIRVLIIDAVIKQQEG